MGRRKQNPEDSEKRHLIMKMAIKMFMKQGYSLVTMDAIAEAVPVSKRTLYNHFKDKKALFTAVMESRCGALFTTIEKALQDVTDPEHTLTEFGMMLLDMLLQPDSINIYRTAITEAFHFPELGELFYESGPKRSCDILSRYMQTLHDRKFLHITNPTLAASVFLGMLKNNVQMRYMLSLKKRMSMAERKEVVEYVVRVFFYGQQYPKRLGV
jgi:AcrR family transcriptional regulator